MDYLFNFAKSIQWEHLFYALTLFVFGYFFAKKSSQLIERTVVKRFSKHQAMLLSRFVFYALFLLFLVSALQEIGFNLTLLLGTAGLFTVGLSFASQTAASNLISGIFLLFERPFKVGDIIAIKENIGTVESIDWLSTKIKTSDNRLIRIPNESLIKTEITNLSTYSQKRGEIVLNIAAGQEVHLVKSLLQQVCRQSSAILVKPDIKILFSKFIDGGDMEIKLMYWTKSDLFMVTDELLTGIQKTFGSEQVVFSRKHPS